MNIVLFTNCKISENLSCQLQKDNIKILTTNQFLEKFEDFNINLLYNYKKIFFENYSFNLIDDYFHENNLIIGIHNINFYDDEILKIIFQKIAFKPMMPNEIYINKIYFSSNSTKDLPNFDFSFIVTKPSTFLKIVNIVDWFYFMNTYSCVDDFFKINKKEFLIYHLHHHLEIISGYITSDKQF